MDFKDQALLFSTAINRRLGLDVSDSATTGSVSTQKQETDAVFKSYKGALQRVETERSLDAYQSSSSRATSSSTSTSTNRALAAPQQNDITLEMKTQVFIVSNPEAGFLVKQLRSGDQNKAETTHQNPTKLFTVSGAILNLSQRSSFSTGNRHTSYDLLSEFACRKRRCCECGTEFSYARPGLCPAKPYQFNPTITLANKIDSKLYFYMMHTSTREEFADIVSGWASLADQVQSSGLALHWNTVAPAALDARLPYTTSVDPNYLSKYINNKQMQIQSHFAHREMQDRGSPIGLPESLQVSTAILENSKSSNVIFPNVLNSLYALPESILDLNTLQTIGLVVTDEASYFKASRTTSMVFLWIKTARQLHDLRFAIRVCENLNTKIDLLQVYMACILSNVQATDNRWFPHAGVADQDSSERFFVPHVVFLRFKQCRMT